MDKLFASEVQGGNRWLNTWPSDWHQTQQKLQDCGGSPKVAEVQTLAEQIGKPH